MHYVTVVTFGTSGVVRMGSSLCSIISIKFPPHQKLGPVLGSGLNWHDTTEANAEGNFMSSLNYQYLDHLLILISVSGVLWFIPPFQFCRFFPMQTRASPFYICFLTILWICTNPEVWSNDSLSSCYRKFKRKSWIHSKMFSLGPCPTLPHNSIQSFHGILLKQINGNENINQLGDRWNGVSFIPTRSPETVWLNYKPVRQVQE